MNGPWATGAYTPAGIKFDVAPIPKGAGDQVTLASTVPIVVSKNTKHREAAFEFLAWWTSQDAQRSLALGSGFPPARTDMANDAELAKHQWVPKFAAAAADSRVYLAGVEQFAQVDSDVFVPAIQRITRGEPASASPDRGGEADGYAPRLLNRRTGPPTISSGWRPSPVRWLDPV